MKCPKCSYLGFETGDRCKNCGYDFSLLAEEHAEPPDPDLNLQVPDDMPREADRSWMDRLHSSVEEVAEAHEMPESVLEAEPALAGPASTFTIEPPIAARADAAYPLFAPRAGASAHGEDDDEPLIKLPAAPRAAALRPPDTRPAAAPRRRAGRATPTSRRSRSNLPTSRSHPRRRTVRAADRADAM